MEWVEFKAQRYPAFQAQGNAAQFALPYAKLVCQGRGYDIGYGRDEWKLPGALGIDLKDGTSAESLPEGEVDYVFSSHCLEHVADWVSTLEHWLSRIKRGGILFLYLPDASQSYWRPWHNRKHKHVLTPDILRLFCEDHGLDALVSQVDLNNSFMVIAQVG